MDDICKNIEEYNPNRKKFFFFDNMIADMHNNEKINKIVTVLFIRGRELIISLVLIMQSYFKVPKDVRLNTTHFFCMKVSNKENLNKLRIIIHQILTLETL